MSDLPIPTARRLQRPSWRSGRLLVGVLLVLVSAVLGARAVAAADDRVPYWVAATDLSAGEPVAPDSLVRVEARLPESTTGYVSAAQPVPDGLFLVRDVGAGELLPAAALGTGADVAVQRVRLRADAMSTQGLGPGDRVDVYVTAKDVSGRDTSPETVQLLDAVAVLGVSTEGASLGAGATTSVQVLVPTESVRAVVAAVDSGARLTLVPVAGRS